MLSCSEAMPTTVTENCLVVVAMTTNVRGLVRFRIGEQVVQMCSNLDWARAPRLGAQETMEGCSLRRVVHLESDER